MAEPKAILPAGIIIAENLTELGAVGSTDGLDVADFAWVESEEAWYVCRSVDGEDASTWELGNGTTPTSQVILRDGSQDFQGDQSMGSNRLTDLATPSADNDAVNKAYADGIASGVVVKEAVRAATTAAGTLASDFDDGSVIDGVALATGDRILIKDQADGSENGIYDVQASGAPVRSSDADSDAEVDPGMSTFVVEGTANAGTRWVLTTPDPITVGTTPLSFTMFASGDHTTATNVGTGADVFRDHTGDTLNLRNIKGVGRLSAVVNGDDVEVSTTAEANAGSNVGTGEQVYKGKTGESLEFRTIKNAGSSGATLVKAAGTNDIPIKRLKAGTNITLVENADDVEIQASGGGGGGPFGEEFAFDEASGSLTVSGTTWQTHLTLTTGSLPSGTNRYLINVTYKLSATAGIESELRIRLDDTTTLYEDHEEGEGTSAKWSAKGYMLTAELGSGTHTIKIQIRNTNGGSTKVEDGRIFFWRAS